MIKDKELICKTFTISGLAIKKNSKQIIQVKGRPMMISSKNYREYEKNASLEIKSQMRGTKYPIENIDEIKVRIFPGDKRLRDNTNVVEGVHDILVTSGVISDDNYFVVKKTSQEFVEIDKQNPRTDIEIYYWG